MCVLDCPSHQIVHGLLWERLVKNAATIPVQCSHEPPEVPLLRGEPRVIVQGAHNSPGQDWAAHEARTLHEVEADVCRLKHQLQTVADIVRGGDACDFCVPPEAPQGVVVANLGKCVGKEVFLDLRF